MATARIAFGGCHASLSLEIARGTRGDNVYAPVLPTLARMGAPFLRSQGQTQLSSLISGRNGGPQTSLRRDAQCSQSVAAKSAVGEGWPLTITSLLQSRRERWNRPLSHSLGKGSGRRALVLIVRAAAGSMSEGGGGEAEGSMNRIELCYNPKQTLDTFADAHDPSRSMRPKNLTLFSPAKVNVFLRVTAKRPDGYHDLASLFHVISLGDTLRFSISPSTVKDSLTTTTPGVPLDDKNLVIQALNLFRQKTGSTTYFWIHLDKRIPTGAGLGGGSSNAATALWAANQLCGGPASEAQLQEWSAEIGSDIPFFFSRGAAYCTGRGELVEDLEVPSIRSTPLVLMKPPDACSTADVYRRFKLDAASSADPRELLARVLRDGIAQGSCVNDLEAPAFEVLPTLQKFKQRVAMAGKGRYQAVFMSGSGSTIVGVGDPEPPFFLYDEPEYSDVFISEARFLTRGEGEWYLPGMEFLDEEHRAESGAVAGTGVGSLETLKLPFSFEA